VAAEGEAMILREVVAGTFLIISILIFAFSGSLYKMFWNAHERDCHQANSELLQEQREGPLREYR